MRVYLVKFFANNFENYEDHMDWEGVVKVFDSEEKAINFINNENCIKPILRNAIDFQTGLYPDQPIQFVKFGNGYDVWGTNEVFSEDGDSVIGYEEVDADEVPRWDKVHVIFSVEGMNVE